MEGIRISASNVDFFNSHFKNTHYGARPMFTADVCRIALNSFNMASRDENKTVRTILRKNKYVPTIKVDFE